MSGDGDDNVMALFEMIDTNGDGTLDHEELHDVTNHPQCCHAMLTCSAGASSSWG